MESYAPQKRSSQSAGPFLFEHAPLTPAASRLPPGARGKGFPRLACASPLRSAYGLRKISLHKVGYILATFPCFTNSTALLSIK